MINYSMPSVGGLTTQPPEKLGQVEEQMNFIVSENEQLDILLKTLEEKLRPLLQEVPETGAVGTPEQAIVGFACSLRDIGRKISYEKEKVKSILNRLEI